MKITYRKECRQSKIERAKNKAKKRAQLEREEVREREIERELFYYYCL